jgi:hypothetical protein
MKRERNRDQNRRETRVEPEELHASLARDEDQRKENAEAEVVEKEEEDHRRNGLSIEDLVIVDLVVQ